MLIPFLGWVCCHLQNLRTISFIEHRKTTAKKVISFSQNFQCNKACLYVVSLLVHPRLSDQLKTQVLQLGDISCIKHYPWYYEWLVGDFPSLLLSWYWYKRNLPKSKLVIITTPILITKNVIILQKTTNSLFSDRKTINSNRGLP